MSSILDAQLQALKKKIKTAPAEQRRTVSRPLPPPQPIKRPAPSPINPANDELQKRRKIIQQESGGEHLSTQMFHAVSFIKEHDRPVRVDELQANFNYPIGDLLPLLKGVDRIRYNAENDTLEYLSLYSIRSDEDLLSFLRSQQTAKGVSVKELKDGWNGCLDAIERLEKSNDIIVLRTKKENSPRLVWANRDVPLGQIEEEFVENWNKIKLPPPPELPKCLEDVGLKPTSVDPATIKKAPKKANERKQKKPRRGKITNVHMRGILKDYRSR